MMKTSMFAEIRDPQERVRALCKFGCQVEVDSTIPPKRYFRSGLEMIRMANVYMDEGDLESTFVLYSKFIALFVEKLPKHPDYSLSTDREKAENGKKLRFIFPMAETIKEKLTKQYTKEAAARAEEDRRLAEQLALAEEQRRVEEERLGQLKEEERQEEARRRLEHEEQLCLEQEQQLELLKEQERQRLEDERKRQTNGVTDILPASLEPGVGSIVVSSTIPAHPPPTYGDVYPGETLPVSPTAPQIPSRDAKPNIQLPTPSVDRSTKPSHFTDTGATTQNKHNFRDVVVPALLINRFLEVAMPNTNRNVETCAILAGKVSKNAFTISHLLIPKQSGTSDTCTTESEEDIFMYQDSNNLITLGWIHTHPSQTAFLSSVDLHTHCSYQQLLPEAIAIVCAPKYNETGYFYLTPHHGLSLISGCRQRGFHEHPKHPPLFESADHVKINQAGSIELVDLRK